MANAIKLLVFASESSENTTITSRLKDALVFNMDDFYLQAHIDRLFFSKGRSR